MTNKTTAEIFEIIGRNFFDHAFTCESKSCVCRGSIFNDMIVTLKEINPHLRHEVNEILDRE